MDYNTSRNKLQLREYGRNVQKLVEYAKEVKTKKERNKTVEAIIRVMGQLNPQIRNVEEYKDKLWHHLMIMADYNIDIDLPVEVPPQEDESSKPEHIGYPKKKIRYKHYGKSVEVMIEKCNSIKDPVKQKEFAIIIGNYMKMVYNNWNKEHINDEVIISDLEKLSGGKLVLDIETNLDNLRRSTRSTKKRPSNNSRGRSSNHRKSNNNGGKRRNYSRR